MKKNDAGRRELRAALRKRHILEAAAKVFAEKGFQQASIKDIAQTAQVAEGTIYNYFKNKYELLVTLFSELTKLDLDQNPEVVGKDPRTAMIENLKGRVKSMRPDLSVFQAVMPEIIANPELRSKYANDFLQPLFAVLEKHLQIRVERGELDHVDIPFVVRCFVGMVGGFYLLVIMGDPVARDALNDPDTFVENIVKLMFEGI